MVQDDRRNSGPERAGPRPPDDSAGNGNGGYGVRETTPEKAQVESRGGPATLSERNVPAEVICAEAVRIAHDICQGVQWNRESARAAALQLVTLLTPSTATGPADARGGLAPWQKRKVDE